MLKNLEQFVPSEVCLKCDGCCRFKESSSVWRPKVAMVTKNMGGLADEIFSKNLLDRTGRIKSILCPSGGFQCSFFEPGGNTCRIYQQRPFECQLYPFVITKDNDKTVVDVHLNCPFVQEMRQKPIFEKYVRYLEGFFQRPEVLNFLRDNPGLVNDYTVYQDELEFLFAIPLK